MFLNACVWISHSRPSGKPREGAATRVLCVAARLFVSLENEARGACYPRGDRLQAPRDSVRVLTASGPLTVSPRI